MDKYQKYLLDKIGGIGYLITATVIEQETSNKRKKSYITYDKEMDEFILTQDEDITKTKYVLSVAQNERTNILLCVNIFLDGEWKQIEKGTSGYKFIVDFNDRTEKIKLSFIDGLADDLIIPIAYNEADKEKYYAKKEQERKEELLKKANIKVSTGADLVNVYFQPCSEDYVRTEIILYKDGMMLAKYKVDEEVFFKSINGLAYGKYEFILKQYDKNNSIILETGHIEFTISALKQQGIRPHINRI